MLNSTRTCMIIAWPTATQDNPARNMCKAICPPLGRTYSTPPCSSVTSAIYRAADVRRLELISPPEKTTRVSQRRQRTTCQINCIYFGAGANTRRAANGAPGGETSLHTSTNRGHRAGGPPKHHGASLTWVQAKGGRGIERQPRRSLEATASGTRDRRQRCA